MKVHRFAITLAAVLFAAPSAQAQLIHHWDFNSGTVTDLVGGATPVSNSATVSGGLLHLTRSAPGWVDFGSQFLIPTTGDFTVSMTFRVASGTTPDWAELLSQGSAGNAFYIGSNHDYTDFRLGDQWESAGLDWSDDNLFHTLVYESIDGGASKFFFDGQLIATKALAPDMVAAGSGLRIGSQYGGNLEYLNADIDDLSIYQGLNGPDQQAVAPEPASLVLLATGLAGIGAIVRRRRR